MSSKNVETVRAGVEALNRHDLDALADLAAPDCEIDMTRAQWAPVRGTLTVEQFQSFLRDVIDTWESARWDPDEYIEAGDQVVVPQTGRFRGRDGVEVEARMTWLYEFRDGTIRRLALFQERDEALEVAGVSKGG